DTRPATFAIGRAGGGDRDRSAARGAHRRVRVDRHTTLRADLEVEVRRARRVAGVTDVADHLALLDPATLTLVAGEVRVVVAVAAVALQRERDAAEPVAAGRDRARDPRLQQGAGGRQHVDALVAAPTAAGCAPRVAVGRAALHRADDRVDEPGTGEAGVG